MNQSITGRLFYINSAIFAAATPIILFGKGAMIANELKVRTCPPVADYSFMYDAKTQFISGEGPSWKLSGLAIVNNRKQLEVTFNRIQGDFFLLEEAILVLSRWQSHFEQRRIHLQHNKKQLKRDRTQKETALLLPKMAK